MSGFDNLFGEKEYAIHQFICEDINRDAGIWMNEKAKEGFVLVETKVITITHPYRAGTSCASITIIMERIVHGEGNAFEGAAEGIEEAIRSAID